jgi:hypothetical protein
MTVRGKRGNEWNVGAERPIKLWQVLIHRAEREEMRKRIKDKFTNMRVSRQRKYQLRMKRDHRCTECGEPAVQGSRCLKHLVKARERQRKKRGLKRRYYGTLSYRLQAKARKKGSAASRRSRSLAA